MKFPAPVTATGNTGFPACAPSGHLVCCPDQRVETRWAHRLEICVPLSRLGLHFANMEKPNVRGLSPSRKAHLALREKLNRPDKPPPLLRTPINSPGRKRHR
ncbi:MAG: hypothetical protein DME27_04705 [Verrucomicrobia bacterium]|nr:MAG: hypothetical protein DME29_10905 [Verrucomicrobiota bacterium]PYL98608.1 MAG: hypothetical protein DME27_04705 [Verrucomicrobiota bacterium]